MLYFIKKAYFSKNKLKPSKTYFFKINVIRISNITKKIIAIATRFKFL